LTRLLSPKRKPDEEKVAVPLVQQLVGCLQYLANGTRPDIAHATQSIAHHTLDPGTSHLRAIQRVLRYLRGTKDLGLVYKQQSDKSSPPQLLAYADADYAGDLETRRSTSGGIILLAGAAIFTKSKRQKTVSLSTPEAELVSITECAREVKYLRNLLQEIGQDAGSATTICDDNLGVVSIANSGTDYKGRMRHLDVSHFYIQELVRNGEILVVHVPSEEQVADILTKPLQKLHFLELREKLGMA
jgi:hypothetical protein